MQETWIEAAKLKDGSCRGTGLMSSFKALVVSVADSADLDDSVYTIHLFEGSSLVSVLERTSRGLPYLLKWVASLS